MGEVKQDKPGKEWYGFSEQEWEELEKLRGMLKPEEKTGALYTDVWLMRFIRARKHNVDNAYKQYSACWKWRAENKIDEVLHKPPSNWTPLVKASVQGWHGFDRQDRPVFWSRSGEIAVDEILKFSVESLMETHVFRVEMAQEIMRRASARAGKNVSTFTWIMDVRGLPFNVRQLFKFVKHTGHVDVNYYPETIGTILAINAPKFIAVLWKILAPIIDPVTRSKIHIVGTATAQAEIDKLIAAEHLPAEYGGRCVCNMSRYLTGCRLFPLTFDGQHPFHHGNSKEEDRKRPLLEEAPKTEEECQKHPLCIPHYKLEEVREAMKDYQEVRRALHEQVVGAGKHFVLKLAATGSAGCDFSFFWQTVVKDIGFSAVFYPNATGADDEKLDESNKVVVVEYARFADTQLNPVQKHWATESKGLMVLDWDNSFSYMTSKTVQYEAHANNNDVDAKLSDKDEEEAKQAAQALDKESDVDIHE